MGIHGWPINKSWEVWIKEGIDLVDYVKTVSFPCKNDCDFFPWILFLRFSGLFCSSPRNTNNNYDSFTISFIYFCFVFFHFVIVKFDIETCSNELRRVELSMNCKLIILLSGNGDLKVNGRWHRYFHWNYDREEGKESLVLSFKASDHYEYIMIELISE